MMGFGLIWMLLFWVGLIVLAVWLVGLIFPTVTEQKKDADTSLSAEEILKVRFAQGELTVEEYQEMLRTIQQERTA